MLRAGAAVVNVCASWANAGRWSVVPERPLKIIINAQIVESAGAMTLYETYGDSVSLSNWSARSAIKRRY
jgi:hypothetical protein